MDILLAKQSIAFLKSYQNLKKANKALTLDALASSKKAGPLLAGTEKRWSNAQVEALRKGEVPIKKGKQNNHVLGQKNYENLIKQGENLSIFTHPDPQKLLNEYGGTGIKDFNCPETVIGSGYREIVDFKQIIGYVVDPGTKERIATTFGKIHYAKDGAHIVPFIKR